MFGEFKNLITPRCEEYWTKVGSIIVKTKIEEENVRIKTKIKIREFCEEEICEEEIYEDALGDD
jgi:hypothetical protein